MNHQVDPRFGVPILGTAKAQEGPNAPGLTASVEIYDSEINEIHKILDHLNDKYVGKAASYADMQSEIEERFHKIGLIVKVGWWSTNVDGVLMPEITISDRTERGHQFDHDQQVHEVTGDLLGLGEGGVIKSDPSAFQKPSHEGHGH